MLPSRHFPSGRLHFIDVARGFAILGILWMNIFIFGLPTDALVIPGIWGNHVTANVSSWSFISISVAGVMRGMISMLFGVSALIVLSSIQSAEDPLLALDRFFKRLLILICLGLFHAYVLLWPFDILYIYGVLGLLIFPFRNLSANRLLIIGGLMLVGCIAFTPDNTPGIEKAENYVEEFFEETNVSEIRDENSLVDGLENEDIATEPEEEFDRDVQDETGLPEDQELKLYLQNTFAEEQAHEEQAQDAFYAELELMFERIQEEKDARSKGYIATLVYQAPFAFHEQSVGMLTNHFWDIFAFFLIGMAMFKNGFLSMQWSSKAYIAIILPTFTLGLVFGYFAVTTFNPETVTGKIDALISDYTYDLRRLSFVFAYFGILALATRQKIFSSLLKLLADCGRVSLSLYLFQTLLYILVFEILGFYGKFEHYEIILLAILLTGFQLLIVRLTRDRYPIGPAEYFMKRLISKK